MLTDVLLRHDADLLAHGLRRQVVHIAAIEPDLAGLVLQNRSSVSTRVDFPARSPNDRHTPSTSAH